MVAFLPLRTMGVFRMCWFSRSFSSLFSGTMYWSRARVSLSFAFVSMRLSRPPMAYLMLVSSPLLRPFSLRSINWVLMPRSLK